MSWPDEFQIDTLLFKLKNTYDDDRSMIVEVSLCAESGPRADYEILRTGNRVGTLSLKLSNKRGLETLYGRFHPSSDTHFAEKYFSKPHAQYLPNSIFDLMRRRCPLTKYIFQVPGLDCLLLTLPDDANT